MTDTLDRVPVTPAADEPSPAERRGNALRLIAVVVGGLVLATVTGRLPVVAVILAVVAMILLHELGHLVTARWAGMKVTEYFAGFGPKLWSVRKGDTEYGVKALPLGGYVKIVGMNNLEEVAPEDEARSYRRQPYWRRMSVAVAGSATHFLIAAILLWVIFAFVGVVPRDAQPRLTVGSISRLADGPSPAQQAGFQVGDRIVAIDGNRLAGWSSLPKYVQRHPGRPVTFSVVRDGRPLELTATPVDLSKVRVRGVPDTERPSKPTGFVGIGPSYGPAQTRDPVHAIGAAGTELRTLSGATVGAIGKIASLSGIKSYGHQLRGERGPTSVNGNEPRLLSPVGLYQVAGEATRNGLFSVLYLLAAINIFVGMFNMVPLPPLDGGLVAIGTYEKVRSMLSGRRYEADVSKLMPIAIAVVMLVVGLGVASLYLDIFRPLQFQ